jgi:hypothetical protein
MTAAGKKPARGRARSVPLQRKSASPELRVENGDSSDDEFNIDDVIGDGGLMSPSSGGCTDEPIVPHRGGAGGPGGRDC